MTLGSIGSKFGVESPHPLLPTRQNRLDCAPYFCWPFSFGDGAIPFLWWNSTTGFQLGVLLTMTVHTRFRFPTLALACIAIVGLMEGCGGAAQFLYQNESTPAIRRDTLAGGTARTTLQNPQDSINGVVKLAPVEMLGLREATIEVPSGLTAPPFDKPRTLMVPPGFKARVHAYDLGHPNDIVLRNDGTIFFSDMENGRVMALGPDGTKTTIADGLSSPFGLDLHEGVLYYCDENRVFRFDFSTPTTVTGTATMLTDRITDGGYNYTRTIRWMPADRKIYISVTSTTNNTPEDDLSSAVVLRMNDKKGDLPVTAIRGVRNTIAMAVHPETGEMWAIDNGTDYMSLDSPPEELNILKPNKHYGWPKLYSQNLVDPDRTEDKPPTSGLTTPVAEFQAHLEITDMAFYTGTAFGSDWRNAVLMTSYGERKISGTTEGCKVMRLRANNDGTGAVQSDIVTGFREADGAIWARPVGIAISNDGNTFYVTDDVNGVIYAFSK